MKVVVMVMVVVMVVVMLLLVVMITAKVREHFVNLPVNVSFQDLKV